MPITVSKGYDPGYFLKTVMQGKENYYLKVAQAGMEPAGRWMGKGLKALGLEAGSVVDPDTLRALFTERIHPVSGEVLGRKPNNFDKLDKEIEAKVKAIMAEDPDQSPERLREVTFMVRSESSREHVNFFDVGFPVPKSASLLQVGWMAKAAEARAAGDTALAAEYAAKAEEIEQVVMSAGETIVRLAEQHVYVRTGHHSATSGEWRDNAGLTAAVFMHHTSRTAKGEAVGDPQLHAHIAFWAYAQRGDGADDIFRSIHAQGLYEMKSYYAAVAELEVEQELQRLGYAIERTPNGDFEVGGLHDPQVIKTFSSRTSEITEELAPHVAAFIAWHGRAPSRTTLRAMSKNATYKTRKPKEDAPDQARQHAVWDAKYRAATLEALTDIPVTVQDYAAAAAAVPELDAVHRDHCAQVALATLQQQRAAWSWPHLALEIRKTLPVLPASVRKTDIDTLVLGMTREALAGGDVVLLKPPAAVEMPGQERASGESVYIRPSEFARYATTEHLLTEGKLVDDAARPTEPVLEPEAAARAVGSDLPKIEAERARLASDEGATVEPEPLSVTGLTNDQALALFGLLQSKTTGNVLVGAAGTGKSHVVAKLAEIVRGTAGRRVIGVTSSKNAARVLAEEGLDEAYTIADFLGYSEGTDVRRGHLPLNEGEWVVIDEAGTTETTALAELSQVVKNRGANLLYTGDPFGQLGSVGAGGAMRLIADELGYFELHEVKRFAEPWEGPASLRVRAGDATAVREYIDRGRVLEGSEAEVTARLVKQYTGSLVAGRNPLLITDANTGAEELSALVRTQLIELGEVDGDGEATSLSDGNEASRGDLVRAMKNSKHIDAGGQKLANRDVLRIDHLDEHEAVARRLTGTKDGQHQYGPAFTIPRGYLAEHSALAYGGNIFVGQGRTVDDSYQLFTDATSRESLYVAMTRGRARNVVGVVTERETADTLGDKAPPPRKVTAEALLTQAIRRERDDLTATETLRQEQDQEYGMPSLVGRWQTLTRDAQFTAYDTVMREAMTPGDYEKVAADPARGTLVRHLRAAELAGEDPFAILREAIRQRDFTSAGSVAAILHGRVTRLVGPVSHKALSSYSAATPDLADPQAAAAARELARLADERAGTLGEQAVADRPVWALHALGEPPADPMARQEWVDRASRIAAWRELASYKDPVQPVGPAPKMGAVELRAAWRGAADAAGLSKDDQGIRETSEMLLAAQAREAIRVKAFQPPDVAQELLDAELAKGDVIAEAQLAEAAAGNAVGPEADGARDLADSHKLLAEELGVRAAWLAEQDEHRRAWHATHAEKVARGVRARAELERRREAGEFTGEWDVAMAYLTLESDLESGGAEPAAEPVAEPEPEVEAEVEPAEVEATATGEPAEPASPTPAPEPGAYPWAPAGRIDPQTWERPADPAAGAEPEATAEVEAEPVTAEPRIVTPEPEPIEVEEPETIPDVVDEPAAEVSRGSGDTLTATPEPEPAAAPEAEDRAEVDAGTVTPEPVAEAQPEPVAQPEPKVGAAAPEPEPVQVEPVTPAEPEAQAEQEPEPEAEVKADPEHKREPVAEGEPEAEADGQALDEPEVTGADRADHFRAIAEHRERAVERPGRAHLDAARAAQARIDAERAEVAAGEPPERMGGTERETEAGREAEAEAGD